MSTAERQFVRRPPFGTNPVVGERGSDTRRRIMAAALEVFGDDGYVEARVESITERAGCSRPAFYQYFAAKEDVFWELAGELGAAMVTHATTLGTVGADDEGVARLRTWVADFMAMHAAWAPVFEAYPTAARDHRPAQQRSIVVSDRTALALLRAFDLEDTSANRRLASGLVAVLLRCSFYAEHTPEQVDAEQLADAVTAMVHRTFAGPVEGVNVVRGRPRRPAAPTPVPAPAGEAPSLRPRGERTRARLLAAAATVVPASGYQDLRVDDIVAAAGVSHGTFYRYFDNRDDYFRVLSEAASERFVDLVERLDLGGDADELRAWVDDWFDAYEHDGGVLSTWPEMYDGTPLDDLARVAGTALYSRLSAALGDRDFGRPVVDGTTLFALLERLPYSVITLGFMRRRDAVDTVVTTIRRGFLGEAA